MNTPPKIINCSRRQMFKNFCESFYDIYITCGENIDEDVLSCFEKFNTEQGINKLFVGGMTMMMLNDGQQELVEKYDADKTPYIICIYDDADDAALVAVVRHQNVSY